MDVQPITDLITALRSETEKNSISPENVGNILQKITDTLSTGVNTETSTRKTFDANLQTAIDAEVDNRKKAVDAITPRTYDYTKIMALTSESTQDTIKAAFTPNGESAIRYPNVGDKLHRGMEQVGGNFALHDDDIIIEKYISDGSFAINGGINNFGIEFTDFGGVRVSLSVYNNVVTIDKTDLAKKRVFIDLWKSACGQWGTYNEDTGYFELNGLTDITYEEALDIYVHTQDPYNSSYTARTNILNISTRWVTDYYQKDCSNAFSGFRDAEVIRVDNESYNFVPGKAESLLAANRNCKKVLGVINLRMISDKNNLLYFLGQNDSLETIQISNLRVDFTNVHLLNISAESVVYMIDNAATDSNITLTLGNGDTYDRLIADASVQAALDGHPNVTLTYYYQ